MLAFPGLCQFKEEKGFKQWTGDDCKAYVGDVSVVSHPLIDTDTIKGVFTCYTWNCSATADTSLMLLTTIGALGLQYY
jgi:hypothetical protein